MSNIRKSLWARYREERGEAKFIEYDWGFISYSINGEECYIQDYYIIPEKRGEGLAWKLAKEVEKRALDAGCKYLTGSVIVGSKDDTKSLKILLHYGMKLLSVNGNIIYMIKELKGE